MSAAKILSLPKADRTPVTVALVKLADGRVVARTVDELETVPLEDQAAVAAQLGVDVPTPGAS